MVGALVAGVSVSLLLKQLTALSAPFGLVVVGYLAFLIIYAVLVSLTDDAQAVRDAVMTVLMASTAVLAFGALALVLVYTVGRGWAAVKHINFYTHDLSTAGPLAPLSSGGMAHALVGTVWMVGIAVSAHRAARTGGRRLPGYEPGPARPGSSAPSSRP